MHRKIIEYKVVGSHDDRRLEKIVNLEIVEGWQPLGGVFFKPQHEHFDIPEGHGGWGGSGAKSIIFSSYMQALVKYAD